MALAKPVPPTPLDVQWSWARVVRCRTEHAVVALVNMRLVETRGCVVWVERRWPTSAEILGLSPTALVAASAVCKDGVLNQHAKWIVNAVDGVGGRLICGTGSKGMFCRGGSFPRRSGDFREPD